MRHSCFPFLAAQQASEQMRCLQVCSLDSPAWKEQVGRHPTTGPSTAADPDSMAFMIFTSGTTGRPKGVMVPHRGLANNVLHSQGILGWAPEDVIWQRTSISFDVHLMDTWMAWTCGSCVVPASSDASFSPELAIQQVQGSYDVLGLICGSFVAANVLRSEAGWRTCCCQNLPGTSHLYATCAVAASSLTSCGPELAQHPGARLRCPGTMILGITINRLPKRMPNFYKIS